MLTHRSLLFVPGNRPERFGKAVESGADLVCIDLEDAVAPDEKVAAREAAAAYLKDAPSHVGLRINEPGSALVEADQDATRDLDLPFVMVPKVDSRAEVEGLRVDAPIMPVLESARAILAASEIMAHPSVGMALFGGGDYAADLGIPMEWDGFLYPRSHLAVCAAAHDVLLFDVPYLAVRDLEGGAEDTRRVAGLGIDARAAIHPAQIPVIHAVMTPGPDAVDQAERLRAAYEQSKGNAALLDGKLIEAPMLRAAEKTLARAKRGDG